MLADGRFGSGGAEHTTNQRMEVQAVLEAVLALEGELEINSDSTYVVNCFKDRWFDGWRKRGWRNSQKKPVANRDLWEPLIDAVEARGDEISFVWVKGHSGVPLNDRADELAVAEVEKIKEANGANATKPTATETVAVPWDASSAVWVVGSTTPNADQIEALHRMVSSLGSDNAETLIVSGLRRGTELLGAERALELGLPVAVVLPFPDPAQKWPEADRARFDRAVDAAQHVVTLGGKPSEPGPAVRSRNAWVAEGVYAAVIVDDDGLADQIDEVGITVLRG